MEASKNQFKNMDEYIETFPMDKPIQYDLMKKIVNYRAKENLEKEKEKNKK